jgi:hypothetical protein
MIAIKITCIAAETIWFKLFKLCLFIRFRRGCEYIINSGKELVKITCN